MFRAISRGVVLALMLAAGQASADVIISNHPGNDGSQTAGINSSSRTKGMGFSMPGGDGYYLDNVVLRLNITDVSVIPRIEIFTDSGGPGVSLITLDNPTIDTLGIGDYTFTPGSDFILEGGTSYWIVASSANSAVYDWKASSPSQTPTGLATHLGATFGAYPPRSSSSILTTYMINGTPVPAPGAAGLLVLGGALAFRRRRA